MSFSILIHPDVLIDYSTAYQWYEEKEKGLGDRFLMAVRKKLERISSQPFTFSSKQHKHYREAKVQGFPFVIVYKIYADKNELFISSVHHYKKDAKKKYRK